MVPRNGEWGQVSDLGISVSSNQNPLVVKTVFSQEYALFRELLREMRLRNGLTQTALAQTLGVPQSFVSKYESGERRLDFIETMRVCEAMGIPFDQLTAGLSDKVAASRERSKH